jgi:hypothetical protein
MEINPNSTVIRSDIQDNTEIQEALKGEPAIATHSVSGSTFASLLCDTLTAQKQGKRYLVGKGTSADGPSLGHQDPINPLEYNHAKENMKELIKKYGLYSLKNYEALGKAEQKAAR